METLGWCLDKHVIPLLIWYLEITWTTLWTWKDLTDTNTPKLYLTLFFLTSLNNFTLPHTLKNKLKNFKPHSRPQQSRVPFRQTSFIIKLIHRQPQKNLSHILLHSWSLPCTITLLLTLTYKWTFTCTIIQLHSYSHSYSYSHLHSHSNLNLH